MAKDIAGDSAVSGVVGLARLDLGRRAEVQVEVDGVHVVLCVSKIVATFPAVISSEKRTRQARHCMHAARG